MFLGSSVLILWMYFKFSVPFCQILCQSANELYCMLQNYKIEYNLIFNTEFICASLYLSVLVHVYLCSSTAVATISSICPFSSSYKLVMPKFGPEPKFEPKFWELDRKFSPKFSAFAELDVKSSPVFTWMLIFLNAFKCGLNRTYGPPGCGPFFVLNFFFFCIL